MRRRAKIGLLAMRIAFLMTVAAITSAALVPVPQQNEGESVN